MQDNLDSTESTSLCLGEHGGDLIVTCVKLSKLPILKVPD